MHALVSWTRPTYAVAAEMMHTAEVSCSSTFDKGSGACCEHFLLACQIMTSCILAEDPRYRFSIQSVLE